MTSSPLQIAFSAIQIFLHLNHQSDNEIRIIKIKLYLPDQCRDGKQEAVPNHVTNKCPTSPCRLFRPLDQEGDEEPRPGGPEEGQGQAQPSNVALGADIVTEGHFRQMVGSHLVGVETFVVTHH